MNGKCPDAELPSYHGEMVDLWYGVSPAGIPLHLYTCLHLYSFRAGSVADKAAMDRQRRYPDLARSYHFIPIAVKSSGAIGKNVLNFF